MLVPGLRQTSEQDSMSRSRQISSVRCLNLVPPIRISRKRKIGVDRSPLRVGTGAVMTAQSISPFSSAPTAWGEV